MSVLRLFADLFFPPHCLGCGRYGSLICQPCFQAIPRFQHHFFFRCPTATGLSGLYVGSPFRQDDLLQTLIHQFKYRYAVELAPMLARLYPPLPHGVLVPVPLHTNRQRERGFNQAALLARSISDIHKNPVAPSLLQRTRDTPPQAMLSRTKRLANVDFAFSVTAPVPDTVILVDDVAATLATLSACAWALRASGAKTVFGAVLARGHIS